MKASLRKEELVALSGGGLLVVMAALLAWMGLGALGEKQTESQALAERLGNPALAALLADPEGLARLGRETAEMQKLERELKEKDAAVLEDWARSTQAAEGAGMDWSKDPGKWKDQLILVQSQLQKEASKSRVQLGADFYLGLEAFRQKSPTADEVPGLALHLSVAERLAQRLLEARQVREQFPTACELRSLSGPGTTAGRPADGTPSPVRPKTLVPGPERKRFRMEILCSPEVLYAFVRLLAQDPWLFILTDLSVTNSQNTFPLRSEIAKKFANPEDGSGGQDPSQKKLLEILAGKESVLAQLELDFVVWKNPEEAKRPAPAP